MEKFLDVNTEAFLPDDRGAGESTLLPNMLSAMVLMW